MNKYKEKCSVFCSQSEPYIDETNFNALKCKELFIIDKSGEQKKLGIYCEEKCDLVKQVVSTKGQTIKKDEKISLALYDNLSGFFKGFLLSIDYDNSPNINLNSNYNFYNKEDNMNDDNMLFNTPKKEKNRRKMMINIGKYSIIDNIGQITPSNIFRLSKRDIDYGDNIINKNIKNINDAQIMLEEKLKYMPNIFKFENCEHDNEYLRFFMPYYIKVNDEYINKNENTLILSDKKITSWILIPTDEEIYKRRKEYKNKITKKVRKGSKFVLCTFPYREGEGQFLMWDGSGNFSFVIKKDYGSIFSVPIDIDAKTKCNDCVFISHKDNEKVEKNKIIKDIHERRKRKIKNENQDKYNDVDKIINKDKNYQKKKLNNDKNDDIDHYNKQNKRNEKKHQSFQDKLKAKKNKNNYNSDDDDENIFEYDDDNSDNNSYNDDDSDNDNEDESDNENNLSNNINNSRIDHGDDKSGKNKKLKKNNKNKDVKAENDHDTVDKIENYIERYKKPLMIGGLILLSSIIGIYIFKSMGNNNKKEEKEKIKCSSKTVIYKNESVPRSFPKQMLITPITSKK